MRKLATFILIIFSVFLSGCSVDINGSNINWDSVGFEKTKASDFNQSAQGISKVEVTDNVGNITLSKAAFNEIKVHSVTRVSRKYKEVRTEILNKAVVSFEKEVDNLKITVDAKGTGGQDFWDWLREKYDTSGVSVDLYIQLPQSINNLVATNGVGNIKLTDFKGNINITSGTGDVVLRNIQLTDETQIKTGTGNINVAGDIAQAKTLNAVCGVGNITLNIPDNSGFSIDARSGIGNISGGRIKKADNSIGASTDQVVNGGGAQLNLTTGTGNITVN